MNHHDTSNLVAAIAIIIIFGLSAVGIMIKEKPKPVRTREPRRPIGHAYMEMFDKIYYAAEVSDMNCIKALLKDYMSEYERHEYPDTLKRDFKTIKKMRLDKISELRGTVSRLSTV